MAQAKLRDSPVHCPGIVTKVEGGLRTVDRHSPGLCLIAHRRL